MQALLSFVFTLALMLAGMPLLRRAAIRLGWIDRPNHRKVHQAPVPLAGGIGIGAALMAAVLLQMPSLLVSPQLAAILSGAYTLLVLGAIDDRKEVPALYKLVIQLLCAWAVVQSGVRIDSLYGLFGIHELPEWAGAALSVLVIAGTVNAYNLMDGVDGLSGTLALLTLGVMMFISNELGIYEWNWLSAAVMGAVSGFLFFNFSKRHKVFMGDAGSLFLGFLIVSGGIQLIGVSAHTPGSGGVWVVWLIIALLFVPVFDSLRVYAERRRMGISPFTPGRNHLHHLLLQWGWTHVQISIFIAFLVAGLAGIVLLAVPKMDITWLVLLFVLLFKIITLVLHTHARLQRWRERIREMEKGR